MLRRFLYLDTETLGDYLSGLEDGVRESIERRNLSNKNTEGGVDAKVFTAKAGGARESEEAATFSDSPNSKFERLLELCQKAPELASWVDVANPDVDFSDIGIGAVFDVECEVYIPEAVKALAASGGMADALAQLENLLPFVSVFDPNAAQGLPDQREREAMRGFLGAFGGKTVAVGEFDESEWRIAGQINDQYLRSDIEGRARVFGKVSNKWGAGKWKPLLALPGSNLLSREQRRALERRRPEPSEENQHLEGPALMLDILAIYR
ncbi:DUF6414 family protein [Streptomyces sp. MAR25Y5]|uniref:DUF6414 family protein n=1 Tax=Streptomyces sp. MAR25Y5 TaxID=2962028 RepID=UPI0020B7EAFE|nr:hypothetical protein [Streptomyces sp. MAR25Y5]MCP3770422.1 hypothetical protein [Streptomyces sp. MAR25Y5]